MPSPTPTSEHRTDADLIDNLLRWIRRGRRDLPWRRRRDPYAVWISEVMLQQTQVATVIPYFERWMARFPDLPSLAAASLDEVMGLWEGMGYYARARNLHQAARVVVEWHNGVLPSTPAELRALPGIGRYTAGAIMSLAFGKAEPVLDGNVVRVLSRVADLAEPISGAPAKALLWAFAGRLVAAAPAGSAGDFNESLIELGATLCSPTEPACAICPIATQCLSLADGTVPMRPVTIPRKSLPHHRAVAAILRDANGRVLLVQRPPHGLLGGLWGFPGGLVLSGESDASALSRCVGAQAGLDPRPVSQLAVLSHTFTHFRMTLHALVCVTAGEPAAEAAPNNIVAWAALDHISRYPMAVTDRKIAGLLSSAHS